jgi:4-hydroxybenzoate polyprenyltransferase
LFLPTATEPETTAEGPVPLREERLFALACREVEIWLQTLHFYGAACIAAFGWAMCRLIGAGAKPWMPMWFCSALLLYNVDRLRRDPSDQLNTPRREAAARRLRPWSWAITAVSAAVLFILPIRRRDWLTLALTAGGGAVCLNYSVPVRGFRLKDVPLLKTFFAPTLVIAAVFGLPLLHEPWRIGAFTPVLILWAWLPLFCNMILCDLRDVPGDQRCGVISVPSRLGNTRTRQLLWALTGATLALGGVLAFGSTVRAGLWMRLTFGTTGYLAGLIVAVRQKRSERFYEWWVEGVMLVPAAMLVLWG